MSARDAMLRRVRERQPRPRPLPAPWPASALRGPALWPAFAKALARMGGEAFDAPRDLVAWLARRHPDARVLCSPLAGIPAARRPGPDASAASLEDVDVAVLRAGFGVAETGSVFLDDALLVARPLPFLAQHVVVLLDPDDLVGNLHDAMARPEFGAARYGVLVSGPSATADIEGVLVRGAQGMRSLDVLCCPCANPDGGRPVR